MPGMVLSPHTCRPGMGVLGPGQVPPPGAALMPGPYVPLHVGSDVAKGPDIMIGGKC